eukprot:2828387-Alexandrium_andersonii.AAC.1
MLAASMLSRPAERSGRDYSWLVGGGRRGNTCSEQWALCASGARACIPKRALAQAARGANTRAHTQHKEHADTDDNAGTDTGTDTDSGCNARAHADTVTQTGPHSAECVRMVRASCFLAVFCVLA